MTLLTVNSVELSTAILFEHYNDIISVTLFVRSVPFVMSWSIVRRKGIDLIAFAQIIMGSRKVKQNMF